MRTSRINSLGWTAVMLRAVERLHRVAALSSGPVMRLLLWRFPIRALRERLCLLTRLEPRLSARIRVRNDFHAGAKAPALFPVRMVQNDLLRLVTTRYAGFHQRTWSPSSYPRSSREAAVAAPAGVAIGSQIFRAAVPAPAAIQHRTAREQSVDLPVMARIVRRTERSYEVVSTPARHIHRPAAAVTNQRHETAFAPSDTNRSQTPGTAKWDSFPSGNGEHAPAINIERIADQVLNQLDHRLIASRERMGRI